MSVLHFDFYRFNFDTSSHSTGIKFRPLESFEGATGIKSDTSGGHFHGSQVSNMNHSYITTTRPNPIQGPKQRAGQFASLTVSALAERYLTVIQLEPRNNPNRNWVSGITLVRLTINRDISRAFQRMFTEPSVNSHCSRHLVRTEHCQHPGASPLLHRESMGISLSIHRGSLNPHSICTMSANCPKRCGHNADPLTESLPGSLRQSLYRMVERKSREAE